MARPGINSQFVTGACHGASGLPQRIRLSHSFFFSVSSHESFNIMLPEKGKVLILSLPCVYKVGPTRCRYCG